MAPSVRTAEAGEEEAAAVAKAKVPSASTLEAAAEQAAVPAVMRSGGNPVRNRLWCRMDTESTVRNSEVCRLCRTDICRATRPVAVPEAAYPAKGCWRTIPLSVQDACQVRNPERP